jgi:hypothetical protein
MVRGPAEVRAPLRSRLPLVAAALGLAVLGCWALANSTFAGAAPAPRTSSRNCPGQQLTCGQLVALGLSYPYPRQPGSYLFVNGVAYPYVGLDHMPLMDARVRAGGKTISARALLEQLGLGYLVGVPRVPVIAYGSNANVASLTRKFVTPDAPGPAVVPVVKGTLGDFDVTWSPRFVLNGAMPATIVPSRGTTVSAWVTWLDPSELVRMNATESVGTLYSYGYLSGARLSVAGPPAGRPGLYVSCFGALRVGGGDLAVRGVPASHRRLKAADSRQALRLVAPSIGWHGSVDELVLDNVRAPGRAASRSRALLALSSRHAEPGYEVTSPCTNG